MSPRSLLLAAAALLALAAPAHAADCGSAASALERALCDTPELAAADAAMDQAYAAILKAAETDGEVHAALVASQARWLAARVARLGGPVGDEDDQAWHEHLLRAIRDRTGDLEMGSAGTPKLFTMIVRARAQRRLSAPTTGGPFAGFRADCDFVPAEGSPADRYGCGGIRAYQNNGRVCIAKTGRDGFTETRAVADVGNGALTIIATCTVQDAGGEPSCPDDGAGPDAHWTLQPKADAAAITPGSLAKVDPEAGGIHDGGSWLDACLTDPGYPAVTP